MAKLVTSCHTLEHLNMNLNQVSEHSEAAYSVSKLDSPHFSAR